MGVTSCPNCVYRTPDEMCRAVASACDGSDGVRRLYRLPYNRFEAEYSALWWLCPGNANPAYRYTKLFFNNGSEDRIRVGIHAEKGVGPSYMAVRKDRELVMTGDWAWHSFLVDCAAGRLGKALDAIAAYSPVGVDIRGGCFGAYGTYRYDWDPPAANLRQVSAKAGEGLRAPPPRSMALPEMGEYLGSHNGEQFIWIDVYVFTELTPAPGDPEAWALGQLWERVIAPLEPFVR